MRYPSIRNTKSSLYFFLRSDTYCRSADLPSVNIRQMEVDTWNVGISWGNLPWKDNLHQMEPIYHININ
jgi:hypothetical protein